MPKFIKYLSADSKQIFLEYFKISRISTLDMYSEKKKLFLMAVLAYKLEKFSLGRENLSHESFYQRNHLISPLGKGI